MSNKQRRFVHVLVFIIIISIFCYFRVRPIYFQTVGYTYDQGRDFLKSAEIVLYKNPTFIGPTTGIMGIYHGAWWYYLLALGFIIFGGWPLGFYYLIFFIQSLAFILFILFARKMFRSETSSLLALIVATSPYLIFNSIFIVNNVAAMPTFLLLLVATITLLDKNLRKIKILKFQIPVHLIMGVALGMTAEFEFAFGLLLIPAYLLLIAIFQWKSKPKFFKNIYEILYFGGGVVFAFLPRALFELKNNFNQTKTLLGFFINPTYHTPRPFDAVLRDRNELFQGYYGGLFMNDYVKTIFTLSLLIFLIFFIFRKKITKGFWFLVALGVMLFFFSTFYKDTFWSYYYDGIQYLFLLAFGYIFATETKLLAPLQKYFKVLLICIILLLAGLKISQELEQPIPYDGIKVQADIVNYIQKQTDTSLPYCVKVYTPPVIPYTYEYLFVYKRISKNIPDPVKDWQNNKCWYIIENDDNNERKDEWLAKNIPEKAKRISAKRIKDVDIELWEDQLIK